MLQRPIHRLTRSQRLPTANRFAIGLVCYLYCLRPSVERGAEEAVASEFGAKTDVGGKRLLVPRRSDRLKQRRTGQEARVGSSGWYNARVGCLMCPRPSGETSKAQPSESQSHGCKQIQKPRDSARG